jgi:hypothetical protein
LESKKLTETVNDSENNIENKENNKTETEKIDGHTSESELDEDKNEINVRIGEEEDDEVTMGENKNEDVNIAKENVIASDPIDHNKET